MKKLCCVFCVILFVCSLSACSAHSQTKRLSQTLGIDLSSGTAAAYSDTHDGFLGDGYTYAEIRFDAADGAAVADEIAENDGWRSLPLTENLQTAVYGSESYAPLVSTGANDSGNAAIPQIEQGYYDFIDRYDNCADPKDDAELFSRYSFNFTLTVYDTANNIFYYYKLDT